MFEAYARNKYTATGVIQWMLNNAWPSLIWHLYDYYLRPGGGYFGTKKACEPVHVQYSYDDRSIALVNDTPTALAGMTVSASVLDFGLATRFSREARVDLPADGVVRAFTLPEVAGLTTTYFLRLSARILRARSSARISIGSRPRRIGSTGPGPSGTSPQPHGTPISRCCRDCR